MQNPFEKMASSNFNARIMKVVQATHRKDDIRYGVSRVYTAHLCYLCQFVGYYLSTLAERGSFDLDCILQKEIFCLNLSTFTDILGWKTYRNSFFNKNSLMNIHFLNIRTGEVIAGAYLVSITDIVNDCQQIGTGVLLIVNNYILGTLWGNQCFIRFDSHSKDETGKISATGTAVLLKFASLQ